MNQIVNVTFRSMCWRLGHQADVLVKSSGIFRMVGSCHGHLLMSTLFTPLKTLEKSFKEDGLHCIVLWACLWRIVSRIIKLTDVRRPNPLWAAPFPRQGSWRVQEWGSWADHKQVTDYSCRHPPSAPECRHNARCCFKFLPCLPQNNRS